MPDVIITPAAGKIEFQPAGTTVTTIDAAANTLHVKNLSSAAQTVFNVEGTNGSLFSVVDTLDGTLMSVNNNAGLPVFEVFSDDSVIAGRFGQNDFVIATDGNIGVGAAIPAYKLDVAGDARVTGELIAGTIDGGNASSF